MKAQWLLYITEFVLGHYKVSHACTMSDEERSRLKEDKLCFFEIKDFPMQHPAVYYK